MTLTYDDKELIALILEQNLEIQPPLVFDGIALFIPRASATQDGYISKEDWQAFSEGGTVSGVTTFNLRTGDVVLLSPDVLAALGYTPINKAGDNMTGPLTLPGAPTNDNHAATKQYVDAHEGLAYTPVNKAGDTMGGMLSLYADPTLDLQAATKQYVDLNIGGPGGAPVKPGQYVLQFRGPDTTQVHHGKFWPTGTALPTFWWDCWCAPGDGIPPGVTGYIISESGSGLHALLWGWNTPGVTGGECGVTGNIWDGGDPHVTRSFGSFDYVAEAIEWCYTAVSWDGGNIKCWINGVVCGVVDYPLQRVAYDGTLQVGGSDHSNWSGKLACLRGFEGVGTPYVTPGNFSGPSLLRLDPTDQSNNAPSFFADYTMGGKVVPDLGAGYNGKHHPGALQNQGQSQVIPQYVVDTSAPTYSHGVLPPQPPGYASSGIPAPPAGALVFDSFNRPQQVAVFGRQPYLGSTEGGSMGPQAWQYGGWGAGYGAAGGWGIINGRACILPVTFLNPPIPQTAYVETGTANQDVRVDRIVVVYSTGETGLAFRYADDQHFWYFHTFTSTGYWTSPPYSPTAERENLHWELGYVDGATSGVTIATGALTNNTDNTLRVNANGTSIKAYVGSLLVASITSSVHLTATKAGIERYYGNMVAPRWDDFTVFPAS